MKWLKRKPEVSYPAPVHIPEVHVDPLGAAADLADGMNARREAELQAARARDAVTRLRASRIRNGFAPVIEDSIIRRYLGGATQ